jgi:hypothetical protein
METGMEEQTYSKVMYIIIGILSVIVLAFVIDVMTGGSVFRSLTCSILWYMPFGRTMVGYVDCGSIPL